MHLHLCPASPQGSVAAKRAPTAADFFARYPQLHPFLLHQLSEAAAALQHGASSSNPSASSMHPSLFPLLVLLSRLRPSQHSRLVGSAVSSAAWIFPMASGGVRAGASSPVQFTAITSG